MATATKATIDHDQIKTWAEERGAWPARVKGTGGRGDIGMIRLDFPGYSGKDSLEKVSWKDFLAKFEERQLALVYRDQLARGRRSSFNKLVGRETVAVQEGSGRKTQMPRRRAKQAGAASAAAGGRRSASNGKRGASRRSASTGASRKPPAQSGNGQSARAKTNGSSARRTGASRKASSGARARA